VDWLVVDHYALDRRWEKSLRPHTRRILAIDDLADRPHDCDLLLDQNLDRKAQEYCGLLSRHTQTLIGPAYALLRPEFAQWREHSLQRRAQPQLQNLLITMGGVDQANATGRVLDALIRCELPADLRITVVMGPTAPWLAQVQTQAAAMPRRTQLLVGVSNMAQLMADSDLCIGAAGSTSWERCCLGLPTLLLVLADNQRLGAGALARAGAIQTLNSVQDIPQALETHMTSTETAQIKSMSQAAAAVSDGLGTQRIVTALLSQKPHG
jgi:UDP-2,4-diacetamido-2,4,6-trideoxy-beta-L-altropyranose hydrolase